MIRGLVFGDVHLSTEDGEHPAWQAFKAYAKACKPAFTVDLGDFISWGMISRFNRGQGRKLEGRRIAQEYDFANRQLDEIMKFSPDHILLQGNHDVWMEEYVDEHPEVEGMVEYPRALGLEARGITYVTLPEQPKDLTKKLSVLHGWWSPKYAARKHLEAIRKSCLFGHIHRFDVAYDKNFATGEVLEAHALGCLCDTRPSYQRARPTQHVNGFAEVFLDGETGEFQVNHVIMQNGLYKVGGKLYTLPEVTKHAG